MQIILSDHNCEGQARQIVFALNRIGLAAIAPVQLILFSDIGLPYNADDTAVWKLCQQKNYLLLTGNRRTVDGETSLELTIRRSYSQNILPVLTVGNLRRVMYDRNYCEQCAEKLAEIILDLGNLHGVMRLYLP